MDRSNDARTVALLLLAGFCGVMIILFPPMAAQLAARNRLEAAALECARTTSVFSDSGIAACYTSRGLPVPGDL